MHVNLAVESAAEHIFPEEIFRPRLGQRLFQNDRALGEFAADVDIRELRADRVARDDHALDELMRILMDDVAVLESARLGLVRVADEIHRLFLVGLDEPPLHAARESRAAASAQSGLLHLVNNVRALHRERLLELLVAAIADVALDVRRVARDIDVFENDPLLTRVRRLHLWQRRVACVHAQKLRRFFQRDAFLKIVIHHRDRRGAAARKALDEFHRKFPIRRDRDRIPVTRIVRMPVDDRALLLLLEFREINPRRSRHIFPQLIRPGQRARKRAADADVRRASGLAAEHRVEGDEFEDIDRLEAELRRDPRARLVRDVAKMLLPQVQQR